MLGRTSRDQNKYPWKVLVLALIIGLLAGLLGGVVAAQFFIKPGPQGEQGGQGVQGDIGPQGPQGTPGVNGTDSVLQMLQNRNSTQVSTMIYNFTQWYNFAVFDSSMEITMNVQQNSKIFVEFSCTHQLEPPASISVRIVVDNVYNSSMYACSTGPPASGTYTIPGHIEFLTDSLNTGLHTIDVQFLKESGSPLILDRTLTVTEMASQ